MRFGWYVLLGTSVPFQVVAIFSVQTGRPLDRTTHKDTVFGGRLSIYAAIAEAQELPDEWTINNEQPPRFDF